VATVIGPGPWYGWQPPADAGGELMTTTLETIQVLLVEDDEDDYLITRDLLAAQNHARFEVDWCSDYDSALAAIREQRHDVYLVDYRLGARTGLELANEGFVSRPSAPVIALTGLGDYAVDAEATGLGFTDFLVKQDLDPALLERSIRYGLAHQRAMRALALSEERYALAARAASAGIWDWDLVSDRIYLSPRWHAVLGQPEREAEKSPAAWFDLVHSDDIQALRAMIDTHVRGDSTHLESELRMRHLDGGWRWILVRALATRNLNGQATRLAGSLSDITERRDAENRLRDGALHDSLTALPNRTLFMDRVDQVLRRAVREPGRDCAVLFVDVDGFKLVNDSISHAAGDRLLIALAGRIAGSVRPGDSTGRIGGDEFTVLLDGLRDQPAAVTIAERLQHDVAEAFTVDGRELSVTASIGIAFGTPGISAAELVRNADIAMYDAKRNHQPRLSIFNDAMHSRVVRRVTVESHLRKAIEDSLLEVHYQPIVELTSGRICALEALARWPGQWPYVPPVDFIPIAEQTGLIGALGIHVLQTAISALADWRGARLVDENVRMSVNLSGRQLDDADLSLRVSEELDHAGLSADALLLEITESTLIQDADRMQTRITDLCASGVSLYLDDYGTGYSSLSALHRYPVAALKIDRSFVTSMSDDPGGTDVIVDSTIALAHGLGLKVVAEGIETAAQLSRLRTIGCEYGQGYLFARPLPRADIEQLLTGPALG
jgi:diguanylate cyclase (GGDEF)-like protein/PAS domain S-box-containing protein